MDNPGNFYYSKAMDGHKLSLQPQLAMHTGRKSFNINLNTERSNNAGRKAP